MQVLNKEREAEAEVCAHTAHKLGGNKNRLLDVILSYGGWLISEEK